LAHVLTLSSERHCSRRGARTLRGARFSLAQDAWRVAHIDEDLQAERWGADAEAMARREAHGREFEAATTAVACARASANGRIGPESARSTLAR
jgi:hypothetical protein